MHRTEGQNNLDGLYTDGPPATVVGSAWLNSIQEELVAVIESAGIALRDSHTDTQDQLNTAIDAKIVTALAPVWVKIGQEIKIMTSNYVILDDDTYTIFLINPTGGNVTLTLPTLADNQKRLIKIMVSHAGGDVIVAGEGVDTINGKASIRLGGQYDEVVLIGTALMWMIEKGKASISTGWINTADWTNRHLGGMPITYNGLAGTFIVGEKITESVSGNTWVILSDTGAVLRCKNATGTGFATNARTITGATSGATANVNGTTKDADSGILHNFGIDLSMGLVVKVFTSSDGTENNCIEIASVHFGGTVGVQEAGYVFYQISSNEIKIQTGAEGVAIFDDSGNFILYDSEDYYYKVTITQRW